VFCILSEFCLYGETDGSVPSRVCFASGTIGRAGLPVRAAGLRDLQRVAHRQVVVLTFDAVAFASFWLLSAQRHPDSDPRPSDYELVPPGFVGGPAVWSVISPCYGSMRETVAIRSIPRSKDITAPTPVASAAAMR
jgi:hypothetical protein